MLSTNPNPTLIGTRSGLIVAPGCGCRPYKTVCDSKAPIVSSIDLVSISPFPLLEVHPESINLRYKCPYDIFRRHRPPLPGDNRIRYF